MKRSLPHIGPCFVLALGLVMSCGGRVKEFPEGGPSGGTGGAGPIDASTHADDRSGQGGTGANSGGANTGGTAGAGGKGSTGAGGAVPTTGAGGSRGGTGGSTAGSAGSAGGIGGVGGAAGAGASGGRSDASDAPDVRFDISTASDAPRDRRIADGCIPMPIICSPVGGKYCGVICDGCGNELDCGNNCPAGQTCGARIANVCGPPCPLCSQIPKCESGLTTVRGTVITAAPIDPDPVYAARVFIPNLAVGGKLPPISAGPSCGRCGPLTSDEAVAATLTGPDGVFVLQNVPAGSTIPLVVQLGDWRYETTIDVMPCVENVLPVGKARLPRTQSEGNIPLTAISTGNEEALECVLRKMGVADSEFSNPNGAGRIHLYRNNGARYDSTTPSQAALVDTPAAWDRYDQVVFACEGIETQESAAALQNFVDYTSKGGRVLATHFAYTWLYQNAGFASAGSWQVNQPRPVSPLVAHVDTSGVTGQYFASWLGLVGALSQSTPPQVSIASPQHDLNAVPAGKGGQRWIYSDNPSSVQQMVIETPINAPLDSVCGRVIYSDFHGTYAIVGDSTFPAECNTNGLTPQEKLLEFMLLRLQMCSEAIPPTLPPPPPPPRTPPCD